MIFHTALPIVYFWRVLKCMMTSESRERWPPAED